MALNEFKLTQNTTEIQNILDFFTTEYADANKTYLLISNRDEGKGMRFGTFNPNHIRVTEGGEISINPEGFFDDEAIEQWHKMFELTDNKVKSEDDYDIATADDSDDKYLSAKAVYDFVRTLIKNPQISGPEGDTENNSILDILKNKFENQEFASGILYTAAINNSSEPINPLSCIIIQSGDLNTDGPISMTFIYKDQWCILDGINNTSESKITDIITTTYKLSEFALKSQFDDFSAELSADINEDVDTKIDQVMKRMAEIERLIDSTITGEY